MFIDTIRMKRDIITSLELLKRWVALADEELVDPEDIILYSETKAWLESLR